jgi:RNA polymerase sigma factor (sigma-70 family)
MSDDGSALHTHPSLLVRVRDPGNDEAWRTFVDIYAPLVYRFVRRRGLQDADAADLSQEVMGEVARSIRAFEYRPDRGRFRDWFFLITRRRLARFFGRRSRRSEEHYQTEELEEAVIPAPDADWAGALDNPPDPDWAEAFNNRILDAALVRIRPQFEDLTWLAFERVWLENRTAAETADELSMRIHSVYVAKSRVLKRLAEEVRDIVEDFTWLDDFKRTESVCRTEGTGNLAPRS